jgi:hypothetical protein
MHSARGFQTRPGRARRCVDMNLGGGLGAGFPRLSVDWKSANIDGICSGDRKNALKKGPKSTFLVGRRQSQAACPRFANPNLTPPRAMHTLDTAIKDPNADAVLGIYAPRSLPGTVHWTFHELYIPRAANARRQDTKGAPEIRDLVPKVS